MATLLTSLFLVFIFSHMPSVLLPIYVSSYNFVSLFSPDTMSSLVTAAADAIAGTAVATGMQVTTYS